MNWISDETFAELWTTARSADEAVERFRSLAGGSVPRWAVIARAVACRKAGTDLKRFPDESSAPRTGPGSRPPGPPAETRPTREPEALAWAREAAVNLMARHGLAGWQFGFNRNVRRAGVCRYASGKRPGRIELSVHFVGHNSWDEILDTILHEIAHALVGPEHGHDAAWKAKCVELGARPERCYGDHVRMPPGRWRAACPACRRVFDRHRRPKRLTGWYCKRCGKERGSLQWQPAV